MYKKIKTGFKNLETDTEFQAIDTLPEYEVYKEWLVAGNVPEPEFTNDEILVNAKESKIAELKNSFEDSLLSGFICSNNIKMDADFSSVTKFNSGYELAKLNGDTTMNVTDFNNSEHSVLTTDVIEMIRELGNNIKVRRQDFINKRQVVNAATNITELELV